MFWLLHIEMSFHANHWTRAMRSVDPLNNFIDSCLQTTTRSRPWVNAKGKEVKNCNLKMNGQITSTYHHIKLIRSTLVNHLNDRLIDMLSCYFLWKYIGIRKIRKSNKLDLAQLIRSKGTHSWFKNTEKQVEQLMPFWLEGIFSK